jgi:tRNA (guanine-N7-)-methyltransferase
MARRALRKVETQLDLSAHLKVWDQLPQPWEPAVLFGRSAPLEIEVGSGKGLFLRHSSTTRPEVNFLGIEVAHKYAEFTALALAKLGVRNAMVVDGDAIRIFKELLPTDSLAAVHVYFPDPWWKMRHRKRRVMRESFVQDVQRALQPGGSLHFWTDVEEYYRVTLKLLAAKTTLLGPLDVPETPAEHEMSYRTHFERRVRMSNLPVYRAEFRKP